MSTLLPLCVLGFVLGGLATLIFIISIILSIYEDVWGEKESVCSIIGSLAFMILGFSLGSYNCYVGNQEYDKVTQIYSLQPSDRFILGTSKGYYYYNLNDTDVISCIDKVFSNDTTLIQTNDIEYPYLLEHKVKWEEKEYFLYVPENVRIIQYSIK